MCRPMQNNTLLVISISWLYHCRPIIHYKDVIKHSDVGKNFSYVLLALSTCVLIQKYLVVVYK